MVAERGSKKRLGRFTTIAGAALLLTAIPVALSGILIFGDPIFSANTERATSQPTKLVDTSEWETSCYTRYISRSWTGYIMAIDYCWGPNKSNPTYFPFLRNGAKSGIVPHWMRHRKIGPRNFGIEIETYLESDPGYYQELSWVTDWTQVADWPYGPVIPVFKPDFNFCSAPNFCQGYDMRVPMRNRYFDDPNAPILDVGRLLIDLQHK